MMDSPTPNQESQQPAQTIEDYSHLLPPGYKQPKPFELAPRSEAKRTGGLVGIGALLLAFFLKFKAVLLFLLNFKWIAIGAKLLLSSGTLLLSIGAWALIFGWWFAAGFVLLILVHELGHYFAIRAYGMEAGLPVFVPFLGAFTTHKGPAPNAKAAAIIAFAGPLVGGLGAYACFLIGQQTGHAFWFALASTMFFINLFNLVPILPLDGGRIGAAVFSKTEPMSTADRWFMGIAWLGLAVALFGMWQSAAHMVGPLSNPR